MKNDVELPEVLEFLKLSRTINRQLNLFRKTGISTENKEIIKKACEKNLKQINKYMDICKEGD